MPVGFRLARKPVRALHVIEIGKETELLEHGASRWRAFSGCGCFPAAKKLEGEYPCPPIAKQRTAKASKRQAETPFAAGLAMELGGLLGLERHPQPDVAQAVLDVVRGSSARGGDDAAQTGADGLVDGNAADQSQDRGDDQAAADTGKSSDSAREYAQKKKLSQS